MNLFQMTLKLVLTFMLSIIPLTLISNAGIEMAQVRYEVGNKEKKDKGLLLIQDNKMLFKDTSNNISTLFDFDRDQMIVLDHNQKTYTIIDPDKFVKAVEEHTKKMEQLRKKHLESLPQEQRELMEKMIEQNEGSSGMGNGPIVINVMETAVSEKIAGYNSRKYNILYNDQLNEEIWVTKELNIGEELDIEKMSGLMTKFKKVNKRLGDNSVKNEEAFINLFKQGSFPMKTIDHSFGETVFVEEVVEVKEKDIPSSEFKLPTGYKEKTVESLLQGAF